MRTEWLRGQMGVVLQENLLFNRSVRDNIALSVPLLDLEATIAVARLAGADEFITKLPNGYDSRIVERGANLSGGQRQRIAIARALARDPRILIFDEATQRTRLRRKAGGQPKVVSELLRLINGLNGRPVGTFSNITQLYAHPRSSDSQRPISPLNRAATGSVSRARGPAPSAGSLPGALLTYHCNIACRHCYNNSGPQLKAQRIPLDPMLALVAQMPEAGIDHLNLTGGEPFLYPSHLTSLIAAGRAAGLRGISIYTNGYWAMSAERAKNALERLAAVGFMLGPDDHIKVSTGAYHQEFVTFDRVLTLARVYYAEFGRRVLVDFEMAPGSGPEVRQQVRKLIAAAGLVDQMGLTFRSVAPLGRGSSLPGIELRPIDAPCDSINQIVFDPDGSVRPCCGLKNENDGIVIGQLHSHRLDDLVKRMQNDPILQFLAREPMSSIFEHIATPRNPDGYAGPCHLCQEALGDVSDKNPVQAALFARQRFNPFWFALPRPI